MPTSTQRRDILCVQTARLPPTTSVGRHLSEADEEFVVDSTPGFTGSDLLRLVRSAVGEALPSAQYMTSSSTSTSYVRLASSSYCC